MRQIKHRNKYLRLVASFAIAALALSSVYVPKVSAAENYFTAEGGTLALDDIDPSEPDGRLVSVTLKAAREMVVHSLHGYFTPVSSEDTGLQTFMSWMDILHLLVNSIGTRQIAMMMLLETKAYTFKPATPSSTSPMK